MSVELPQPQDASYDVPKWAGIISWMVPLACCAFLVWMRETPWTKGTVPGLGLTYIFGWMWIRMAVRLVRGEPIPSFVRKPPIGQPVPKSGFDSRVGTLFQATIMLAASIGLALYW